MRLTTLRLRHFRNHLDSWFDFGDGTNILLGDNGQGKTNVLEAISYLCLTKSFFAGNDALSVNFAETLFEVAGTFVSARGVEHRVRVAYDRERDEKRYTLNDHAPETFSAAIGMFPVVICSPEHAPVTSAGPGERRKFVDLVISQSSASYFQTLLEYRRVLKQRNKILLDGKLSGRRPELGPWDEQLIALGSFVSSRRAKFVEEFQPVIESAYGRIAGPDSGERPAIAYRPAARISGLEGEAELRRLLREELDEKVSEELRSGVTLVGPHRDEFPLTLNGLDLRKFASQGQHKTFLIALKFGEFFYLQERCGEMPMLLLDDVFSELDDHRAKELLQFVETLSQTFITSTNARVFEERMTFNGRNRMFPIRGGALVQEPQAVA